MIKGAFYALHAVLLFLFIIPRYYPHENKFYCTPECKRLALAAPAPAPQPAPKPAPQPSPFAKKIVVKNDVCSACDKECYAMDKMEMMNKMWHKRSNSKTVKYS